MVGITPAEMRVVVMRCQVVAAGFDLFLFLRLWVDAAGHFAGVPYRLLALVVGFFVADEVFGADEADVEALGVAFGAGVLFVGGTDDEARGPAGAFGFFVGGRGFAAGFCCCGGGGFGGCVGGGEAAGLGGGFAHAGVASFFAASSGCFSTSRRTRHCRSG